MKLIKIAVAAGAALLAWKERERIKNLAKGINAGIGLPQRIDNLRDGRGFVRDDEVNPNDPKYPEVLARMKARAEAAKNAP